jgi:hypothetical protein
MSSGHARAQSQQHPKRVSSQQKASGGGQYYTIDGQMVYLEGHDMRMYQGFQEQQQGGVISKAMGAIGWAFGDDTQTKRLEAAQHAISFYQRQVASLQAENEGLNADLLELRGTNQQFVTDLREAQVKSFKELGKDSWVPLEDRVISEKLSEIHKELEDWVDENCIDDFEQMQEMNEADQAVLLDFFRKITIVKSDNLMEQIKIWEAEQMDVILLITSVITHQMYLALFTNPFLVIDSVMGSTQAEQYSSAMKQIYQALLSGKSAFLHCLLD